MEPPVLDVNNRIIVLDSREQKPLGIPWVRRNDRLDSRDMAKEGMVALGVLGSIAPAAADDCTYDHGHGLPTSEHRLPFRRMVDELIHRQ
jgi:hypothetical protein